MGMDKIRSEGTGGRNRKGNWQEWMIELEIMPKREKRPMRRKLYHNKNNILSKSIYIIQLI
jgi:hypothetical protein